MPRKRNEDDIQRVCVKWFRLRFPEPKGLIFSVPNGGSRNKAEAGKLKSTGVRAGIPDLVVVLPENIFFIEMKFGKGTQGPNQKIIEKILKRLGFNYYIARTFDEFENIVNYEYKKAFSQIK